MRRALVAALLTVVIFFAASAPPVPQPAQAFDPQVQIAKAAFAAFKARFHDRAAGFRTIKESQAEAAAILEEKKAQANWAAGKGYITKEQAAAVAATLDKVAGSLEELAKQERRMVRNDTRFLTTFTRSLGRALTDAAPQILAEQIGLPPLGARAVGSIIQGEKPAVAALDALITKLSGDPLVEPSKEPFEDLMKQVDALEEAASALRGVDRVRLLGELTGVRQRISDITGLPIPEATEELEQLRAVFDEAEATIAELGKVRDGWVPRYAGPSSERFQNNPQWQEIWGEIVTLSQSPEAKVKDAVAAGMSLTALEKVKEELIARGIDPDSADLDDLAAQVVRERIRGLVGGSPVTVEQAVQTVLGVPGSPGDGDEPDLDPEADADGDTIANASDLCPQRPETFNGIDDFDGCPDAEADPDGDGIEGDTDECPDKAEDRDGFEDSDGCPDPDNDGDGIPDGSDSCPDEAEDLDGFEDSNGCPDPDNDGDGILDTDDSCPDDAEDPDGYQDSDGCPDLDSDAAAQLSVLFVQAPQTGEVGTAAVFRARASGGSPPYMYTFKLTTPTGYGPEVVRGPTDFEAEAGFDLHARGEHQVTVSVSDQAGGRESRTVAIQVNDSQAFSGTLILDTGGNTVPVAFTVGGSVLVANREAVEAILATGRYDETYSFPSMECSVTVTDFEGGATYTAGTGTISGGWYELSMAYSGRDADRCGDMRWDLSGSRDITSGRIEFSGEIDSRGNGSGQFTTSAGSTTWFSRAWN